MSIGDKYIIWLWCQFHGQISTNFQVPRPLALTPPPHSSHDYLPNLTLSVGMDLDS